LQELSEKLKHSVLVIVYVIKDKPLSHDFSPSFSNNSIAQYFLPEKRQRIQKMSATMFYFYHIIFLSVEGLATVRLRYLFSSVLSPESDQN
jgi:hypothetical protein